jgi:hypothetical protein
METELILSLAIEIADAFDAATQATISVKVSPVTGPLGRSIEVTCDSFL